MIWRVAIGTPRGVRSFFSFFSKSTPPPRVDEFASIQSTKFLQEQNKAAEKVLDVPKLVKWRTDFQNTLTRFHACPQTPTELIEDYWYYSENSPEGAPIYYRQHKEETQATEILDLRAPTGQVIEGYSHVGLLRVSLDTNFLAFTLDVVGNEMYTAYIKDLRTGRLVGQIEHVVSLEWAEHNSEAMLVYTTGGSEYRASMVRLRGPSGFDQLLYTERDSKFQVDLALTKDRSYLLVKTSSRASSEVWVAPARSVQNPLTMVRKRQPEVEYFVEHSLGRFIMVCEDSVFVSTGDTFRWRELIARQKFTTIQEFDVFKDHIVLYQRRLALPQVSVICLSTLVCTLVPLPHPIGEVSPGVNANFSSSWVRFCFSNPVCPMITFEYEFSSQTTRVVQQDSYDDANFDEFSCELVFVSDTPETTSEQGDPNGHWVPMTIVRRKGDTQAKPLLFHAYGAYGMNMRMGFDPSLYGLLQQGWSLAFCHARGGGELGPLWHRAGSLQHKKQTFKDIVTCARHLVASNITQTNLLAGWGVSAGGMALAAVANSESKLFSALVLKVPAVDLLGSLLDPTAPTTEVETGEWGDPSGSPEAYAYLAQYSPYDNLPRTSTFPSIYLTGALNDPRVSCWETARYVAKVQKMFASSPTPPLVLLRTDMEGGHAQTRDDIEAFSFLYHVLGLLK